MSRLKAFVRRGLPIAALVAVCMLAATIAATLAIIGSGSAVLKASVSSRVPLDYSADKVALRIPRLSPEIIDAIRRDRSEGSGSGAPGGPPSQTPGPRSVPTAGPSGGATPTPTPSLPLHTPLPTLPVPTPTPLPIPTLPATLPPPPTFPPTPTLPALP